MAGLLQGLHGPPPPPIPPLAGAGPEPDIENGDPASGDLTVHQQAGEAAAAAGPRAPPAAGPQQVGAGTLALDRDKGWDQG